MKIRQVLVATATAAVLTMPVMAAETLPAGTSNAPQTGPNSTAIPEVPAAGMKSSSSTTSDDGTTGTISKDGGASATDLQHQLTTKGYTSITPADSAGATTSGQTRFNATNADGKKVHLTVNANTGAIVKEMPAE